MLKNSSNSGVQSDKKLYVLNLVEKTDSEAVKPYFKVLEKDESTSKWVDTGNQVTEIDGDLVSISVSSFTYKGDEIKKINLLIADEEQKEAYLIGFNFKSVSRSLFNSLLSLTDNKGLKLQVYRNKKGRVAFYLTQGGNQVSWKYEIAELPQPIEILHPKTHEVVSRDYDEINDFFVSKLEDLAAALDIKFGDGKPKPAEDKPEPSKESEAKSDKPVEEAKEEEEEDLF